MRYSLLILLTFSYHSISYAQKTVYEGDYGSLTAGVQIQQATILEANNRSGDPKNNELSDAYAEITIEPNVRATINLPEQSQLYAGFSYIYSGMAGHDPSGMTRSGVYMPLEKTGYTEYGYYKDYRDAGLTEEKHVGWRSGKLLESWGENAIDLSAGAQDYKLGTGLLLANGSDDGGFKGSYWIGSRTAFTNTLIARINTHGVKLEGFHLETRPRNPETKRNYDGVNIEYNHNDIFNIGFTYIHTNNKGHRRNLYEEGTRNVMAQASLDNDTYNARLSVKPLPDTLPNLTLNGEYVHQQNKTVIQPMFDNSYSDFRVSQGGYAEIVYKFADVKWQPTLSYRYTRLGKNFDSMSYGFKTWGTWFQGEINGEVILDNSNLITHSGKLTLTPTDNTAVNLIYFNYEFVNPAAYNLTSANYGNEVDLLGDWSVNEAIDLAAGLEVFVPEQAAKEYLGGNKVWVQGMFYASYKF